MEFNTEYLIKYENSIDWKALSNDKERSFSLAEIRIFRKRIFWIDYLHNHTLTHYGMEVASKYFNKDTYKFIALNNLADQEFIQDHAENFNWDILLEMHYLSQETLMKCVSNFSRKTKEEVFEDLTKNKTLDINDGSYDEFLVYMNLKS